MVYGDILYSFKEEFIMIIVKNAELFEKTNVECRRKRIML